MGPSEAEEREDQGACLENPLLQFDELVWRENDWTELGEELLDPHLESLLEPKFVASLNHNSGHGDACFLALDGLFVILSIGEAIGIVKKWDVGGSSGNQILCHFHVKVSPFVCWTTLLI